MGILRNETNKNFTIVGNYILQSSSISLKAVGMYCKLSSLPDNWRFTEAGLVSICKDGLDSVRSSLTELENNNLLYRFRIRDDKGKLGENVYYISSIPMTEDDKKKIIARYNPLEIITIPQENPLLENPILDNPFLEKPQQYNTNILNTNKSNTNKYDMALFDRFYSAYPKKKNKGTAEKWFIKHKPDEETVNKMIESINKQKETEQWKKDNGQFIPYPSSWLNAKGWEDEVENNNQTKEEYIYNGDDYEIIDGKLVFK